MRTACRATCCPTRSVPEKIREALLADEARAAARARTRSSRSTSTRSTSATAPTGSRRRRATYFGKHASQLTVLESASLAGVLHAPELYDPIDRPSDNWFRRNYAIDQMVRYGYLEPPAGERLKKHTCCGTIAGPAGSPGCSRSVGVLRRPTSDSSLFERYGERARLLGRDAGDDDAGSATCSGPPSTRSSMRCPTPTTIRPPRSCRSTRARARSWRWPAAATGRRTR